MHIAEDDLYSLASAELNGVLLTDEQSRWKMHFGECRECYERYCIYLTMLDLTGSAFWAEEDEDDSEEMERLQQEVFLQIQMAGAFLASIQTKAENAAPYWNFMHMPQIAASRGSGDKTQADIYISRESEYSQIRQEGQQLVIQLDEDVFPVECLGVRYREDGRTITRRFVYNEKTECCEVIIDRGGCEDDMAAEIIWLGSN